MENNHQLNLIKNILSDMIEGKEIDLKAINIDDNELIEHFFTLNESCKKLWKNQMQLVFDEVNQEQLNILKSIPLAICITSSNGNIEYTNPFFQVIFGYETKEIFGENIITLFSEDGRNAIENYLANIDIGKKTFYGEWEALNKDYEKCLIKIHSLYFNSNSGKGNYCFFLEDITEFETLKEKKTSTEVKLNNCLKEISLLHERDSKFEVIMKKEILEPMVAIKGFSELLKKNINNEKNLKMLNIIEKSSNNILDKISSCIDYLKLETGKSEINQIKTNLIDIINKILVELNELVVSKNLQVDILNENKVLDSTSRIFINCDEEYLHNLFRYLLRNMIKLCHNDEIIEMSLIQNEFILIDFHLKQKLKPEVVSNFFNPDYNTKEFSGLDNYISKLITKLHLGELWFTSNNYDGTHIMLKLAK